MNFLSYSQAQQDLFAFYVNRFARSGYFLDLGCSRPFIDNSSAVLESLGWRGLLIDCNQKHIDSCLLERRSLAIRSDLSKSSLSDIMKDYSSPEVIDYVSMDLDDCAALPSIKTFDFSKHKIKCMTFEHDSYLRGNSMRDESRVFLNNKGLIPICRDVCISKGNSFEDWYVNPNLISKDVYSKIECDGLEFFQISMKY